MSVEPPVFEPYFLRWESVLFQPFNSERQIPLYVHKTCGQGYHTNSKYPVKVCPSCERDTVKEQAEIEAQEADQPPQIILP